MTGWGRSDVRETLRDLEEEQATFDADFEADPDKYIEEYCDYYRYDRPPTAASEQLISEHGQDIYDFIMDPPEWRSFLDDMRELLARDRLLSERQIEVVKQIRDEMG